MAELITDPKAARRRYLAQVLYKLMTNRVTLSDLQQIPRKKLAQVAEVGYIKLKHGRFKEAREIFEALSELDHVNSYYRAALGSVFQKQGQLTEAVMEYNTALGLNPGDVACRVNRGEILLRTKNYKMAAEDFRTAIIADPNGTNLWANRARSLVIALKLNLDRGKTAKKVQTAKTR